MGLWHPEMVRAAQPDAAQGQFLGVTFPPAWGTGPIALGGLPISDVQLSSGGAGRVSFVRAKPLPGRRKYCQIPKGTGPALRRRVMGGLVRKRRNKRGRKYSFSSWWLWEGGSWLLLMVLQVFTKNGLKSRSLPSYTNRCVKDQIHFCWLEKEKNFFFFFWLRLGFCAPNCETQGLASLYPMLPHQNGAEAGGVSEGPSTATAELQDLVQGT